MRTAIAFVVLASCHGVRPAPTKEDRIIFSHDYHQKLDFDCDTCHKDVEKSQGLSTSLLPTEATCLGCHQEHKDSKNCGFCHTDPDHPRTFAARPRDIDIPHARHMDRKCASCHPTLPEPDAPPPARPTMAACTSCHQHEQDYAQARCEPCHKDLWRFPVQPVATFSHQGNFLREHGPQARTSAVTCGRCHDQTFCADCHAQTLPSRVEVRFPEEVLRRFIHRGDYVSGHVLDARADAASCARCHGTSFCASCHDLQRLTTAVKNPRDPHPPGWAYPGNAAFHGEAARRDILSCASCHDQGAASICVGCHRVGGVGGNPHPTGFIKHHDQSEARQNGMCLVCHR